MAKNLIILLLLLLVACSKHKDADHIYYYHAQTTKPYAEVLAELKIAITEYNFRITSHSRVGKIIRQRDNNHFPEYDTLQFCNLTHAKAMLKLSPHTVRHMPCTIIAYAYDNKIIIKARLLPVATHNIELNKLSSSINNKLKYIVDFAAEQ